MSSGTTKEVVEQGWVIIDPDGIFRSPSGVFIESFARTRKESIKTFDRPNSLATWRQWRDYSGFKCVKAKRTTTIAIL